MSELVLTRNPMTWLSSQVPLGMIQAVAQGLTALQLCLELATVRANEGRDSLAQSWVFELKRRGRMGLSNRSAELWILPVHPACWLALGFSSSAVSAAIAQVKFSLFPLPDDVAGGCPTRGSVCIVQTLQAGGSQLAQKSLLVASSLKLATEKRRWSWRQWAAFWSCSEAVGFLTWRGTGERCHCSILAPTIQTEPGAAVPGRNKMLPG